MRRHVVDRHRCSLPYPMDAVQLTERVLRATPGWLHRMLALRDAIVSRLGFADQPNPSPGHFTLAVGESAGPFTWEIVSPERVVGGNADRHMRFHSTSSTSASTDHDPVGVLTTEVETFDLLGTLYVAAIWPAHRLLMPLLLRRGMRS